VGLRPYQEQAIQNILERREAGVQKQLASLFTGGGKTVIFANLPEHMPKGSQEIVIAHTEELVEQAAEKIAKWNPHLSIAVDMANRKADGREDVIVASVQSLSARNGARLEKYDPARVCWLVVDEAHHAVAGSYRTVIDHFMVNPFTTLTGFTATPNRADGLAMGSVFEEIVFQYGMLDGISDGWLSDVHGFMLKTGADISHLNNRDFNNDEKLTKAINTVNRNEALVKGWIQYLWPRQTIFFTQNIQHAIDLEAAFKRQGLQAAAVWGSDPDRRKKLEAYRRGDLQILINAQLLIEGFDMWQVEAVVPATPIKSQGRLIQMVGRGTRLQEGISNLVEWRKLGLLTDEHKQNCLVMDPMDNFGRHSLATLPSLFGLSPKLDLQGQSVVAAIRAIQSAQAKFPNADLSNLEQLDELDIYARQADMWQVRFAEDVKGFSELQWTKRGDGSYRLLLPKNTGFLRVTEDMVGHFTVEGVIQQQQVRQEKIASLAEAVGLAEKEVSSKTPENLILLGRERKWMKGPVTGPQMNILKRLRVPDSEVVKMTRGQAAAFITQRFGQKRG
jgi:ATP-dependent helicase IRC3